jgi:hypothetical protein
VGASSHSGDVEPFAVTLAPNPACRHGYGVAWAKTVAHEGTATEHVDQQALGGTCTWGRLAGGTPADARIYASENKHGLYLSDDTCDDAGVFGSENCSESFTLAYTVTNVGEDGARRVDELSGHQFPASSPGRRSRSAAASTGAATPARSATSSPRTASSPPHDQRSWGGRALPHDVRRVARPRGSGDGRRMPWASGSIARARSASVP